MIVCVLSGALNCEMGRANNARSKADRYRLALFWITTVLVGKILA